MNLNEPETTVDLSCTDPKRNMYGCLPCPKCGSEYRACFSRPDSAGLVENTVECSDCGYAQPARVIDDCE